MKMQLLTYITTASLLLSPASLMAQDKPKVQTTTPKPIVDNRTYSIPGRTEAFDATTIFTRATGIVRERNFDIGDVVKTGDVLATIDVPELDRAIDSAQASIDQAKARAANAKSLADRARGLISSRAVSQEELEERQASATELDAAVRVAEAELAGLKEQQGFATVRAPYDGVISGRNFSRGDRVRGDSATAEGWLYRLVNLNKLRFVVAAPPDLATQLKPGMKVKIQFNEMPDKALEAEFSRASGVFDTTSGTMRVELLMDNADRAIPAGLTGTATFTLPPTAGRFLVPTNTLIVTRGQNRLATVADGKAKLINVGVGRTLGANVEARSGDLAATSQIIVNPNAMLRDGDAVEVQQPQAQSR